MDYWNFYFHSVNYEARGVSQETRDDDEDDVVAVYTFYPKKGYTVYKTAFTTLNSIFESVGGIFASLSALAMLYVSGYAENYFKKTIASDCKDLDRSGSLSHVDDDKIDDRLKEKVSWSGLFTLASENET